MSSANLGKEEPVIEADELLCSGRRVKLYRRTLIMEGRRVHKDLVSFGESVVVLPLLDDGKAVFVKQWRAPLGRWIIELPAGRIEKGEDPKETALRELEEETGYLAESIERVSSAYVSPGYSDELMHMFIARGLKEGEPRPEKGELLRVAIMRPEDYLTDPNGPKDMKSIALLLLYLSSKVA
ncbi:MAG: NUDIX hydrolase [Candidatus Korarchaeum sp.]|nr:NUDIX hydrolase [Candidatus Korarchaeum sp.]MDW8035784.1 NUDIX hydrolase [Candidatus Korarchaeum sp.]